MHLHACPDCGGTWDHADGGCRAPLWHRCRPCYAASRAWAAVYAARGRPVPAWRPRYGRVGLGD